MLEILIYLSACSIYYPSSYRAFIPKQWDSEYKEYERLCRENIGKVVYATEIKLKEKAKVFSYERDIRLGEFIYMKLREVETRINDDYSNDKIFYLYVAGFKYYTGWTYKSFTMHDDSK